MRIELTSSAWKAVILPLNYTCVAGEGVEPPALAYETSELPLLYRRELRRPCYHCVHEMSPHTCISQGQLSSHKESNPNQWITNPPLCQLSYKSKEFRGKMVVYLPRVDTNLLGEFFCIHSRCLSTPNCQKSCLHYFAKYTNYCKSNLIGVGNVIND